MNYLLSAGIDEGAALGHGGKQGDVDGILGLWCEGHMQRHRLGLEEFSNGIHRVSASRLDGVLGDVWIIG